MNKPKLFGTVGLCDAPNLPLANLTMAAGLSELRASLAYVMSCNPPADMIVELEVPKNMNQADVDVLCGADAHRIIVKRKSYELF
jgi:hypothetical protein